MEINEGTRADIESLIPRARAERVPVKDDNGIFYVARESGQVLGFVNMLAMGKIVRFRSDWVRPESRRQGVYRLLFDVRMRMARQAGFLIATAFCTPMSLGTFEKAGFKRVKKNTKSDIWFVKKAL